MANRDSELRRLGKTLIQVLFWLLLGGTLAYANADWHKQSPIPGPGNQVVATAVTPDGTRAATVTNDGHITLWDLNTRKLIRSKHLPQGTPHHLAIRNQADAIAVAYEDADAVIWWCDGSDKLVLPDVRARLVAFANQKRLLAVAQQDGTGSSWQIDSGLLNNRVDMQSGTMDGPYFTVLPGDEGAITFDTIVLGVHGFSLDQEASFRMRGGSYSNFYAQEPQAWHAGDQVNIHYFDTTDIEPIRITSDKKIQRLPHKKGFLLIATSRDEIMGSMNLNPWYSVAAVSTGPGQASGHRCG